MRKERQKGAVIEKTAFKNFTTEIRFDKDSGLFTAQMPVGMKPLSSPNLNELRRTLRDQLTEYKPPGRWEKRIYVHLDSGGPCTEKAFYTWSNRAVSCTPQKLELGFDTFEQYVMDVPREDGKISIREYREEREEGVGGRWGSEYIGELVDASNYQSIPWSKESEDSLREIQLAMEKLGKRLEEIVASPTLLLAIRGQPLLLPVGE